MVPHQITVPMECFQFLLHTIEQPKSVCPLQCNISEPTQISEIIKGVVSLTTLLVPRKCSQFLLHTIEQAKSVWPLRGDISETTPCSEVIYSVTPDCLVSLTTLVLVLIQLRAGESVTGDLE